MSGADKPEAGRTCDRCTCNHSMESHRLQGCVRCGCLVFVEVHRQLNQTPRTVERSPAVSYHVHEDAVTGEPLYFTYATCERDGCPFRDPSYRPVERCSCAESVALRKALVDVVVTLDVTKSVGTAQSRSAAALDIARRALALGGENGNG